MKSQNRFRVGLIGAGYISDYHIAALKRLDNVEIVGVCDRDEIRAKAAAEKAGTRALRSPAELRAAGAQVMHVLTPPDSHASLAIESLNLGCHVLVEKPLALDVADCRDVQTVAKAKNLHVCVNHSLLFDPQIRRALRAVRSGRIGRVTAVDIIRSSMYPPYAGGPLPPHYRSAGYPFRDLGVHCLYLLEAFLGPVQNIHAQWSSHGGDPNLVYDEWRAQVRCRDGLGQFQLSWNVKPMQSQILIQGTRGVLRVDLFLMFQALRAALPLPKPAERIVNALTDSLAPMIDVPRGIIGFARGKIRPYHGLQDLVAAFYRALQNQWPAPVSIAEATRAVKWTEEVARAADAEHHCRMSSLHVSERVPVLVTGASGALGSEIIRRLQDRRTRVRLMVRRIPARVSDDTEVVVGNLGDPHAVDRAVRGAQVVIHAGAAMNGGWIDHECGTVAGTQNVVDACLRHHVHKLVHVSSMSVVDWAGGDRSVPIDEKSPLEPRPLERGHYTRAKLEAEQRVLRAVRENRLPAVILRPGQIFGGRIPLLTPAVARPIGGRWLVLGDGQLPLPLIHIADVVDAILQAADGDLREGQIIQLVAPDSPTQNQVLQWMSLTSDRAMRIVRVPRFIVFTAGWASEVLLGLAKRKSPLSRYRLRSALTPRTFRCVNLHLLQAWSPRLPIRESVLQTLQDVASAADEDTLSGDRNVVVDSTPA